MPVASSSVLGGRHIFSRYFLIWQKETQQELVLESILTSRVVLPKESGGGIEEGAGPWAFVRGAFVGPGEAQMENKE